MINAFVSRPNWVPSIVSRPNWVPSIFEHKLTDLYRQIEARGFQVNTVGKTHAALRTPFEEMRMLMQRCNCTIVLGLPHIFVQSGRVKHGIEGQRMTLSTEWNQIEATASLMLKLPTLILLQKKVSARGVFEKGAADLFIYDFDVERPDWVDGLCPALDALKAAVDT